MLLCVSRVTTIALSVPVPGGTLQVSEVLDFQTTVVHSTLPTVTVGAGEPVAPKLDPEIVIANPSVELWFGLTPSTVGAMFSINNNNHRANMKHTII